MKNKKNNHNLERIELTPQTKKEIVFDYLLLIAGVLIRAIGMQYFILPYNFAPGGTAGISAMLYSVTGWNAGIFLLIINVPILIISYFFFNRRYCAKTTIALVLGSVLLIIFDKMDAWLLTSYSFDIKAKLSVGDQTILAAIAGGVFCGVALAMVSKAGGSNGGTEVLGAIIQRKMPSVNISWFISMLDASVILISVFVYSNGLIAIMLSLVMLFCTSKMCEVIMQGFKTATKFEVITTKPEELGQELIREIGRGVTKVDAVGMYSHQKKAIITCIIRKRQIPTFYKILKRYPEAFAYITSTNEVIGVGFSRSSVAIRTDFKKAPKLNGNVDHVASEPNENSGEPTVNNANEAASESETQA